MRFNFVVVVFFALSPHSLDLALTKPLLSSFLSPTSPGMEIRFMMYIMMVADAVVSRCGRWEEGWRRRGGWARGEGSLVAHGSWWVILWVVATVRVMVARAGHCCYWL